MANILNYGADPTGAADSTTAIQAAIAATPISGTVCFPMTATGGLYKVQADQIDAAGRLLQGDYAAAPAGTHSTLIAGTAGTSLLKGSTECSVVGLQLNGAGLVQYGLRLTSAGRSLLDTVEANNCLAWGISIENCLNLNANRLFSHNNLNGIRILGSDGAEFNACQANLNTTLGVYIAGTGSGLTVQEGAILWLGGIADVNVAGPQFVVDGAAGAFISGCYIEGGLVGLQILGNSVNCEFEHLRFVIGDTAAHYAIRIEAGLKNTFVGCSAPGTNGKRIYVNPAASWENDFVGCFQTSGLVVGYMTIYIDDGGGTVWQATQEQAGLISSSPPPISQWLAGTVVWNNAPGVITGWRCTVSGTPGTWVAF